VRVLGRVDGDRGCVRVVGGRGGRRPRHRPGRVATGVDVDRSFQPGRLDVGERADQRGEQLHIAGDRAQEWDGPRLDVRVVPRGVHVQVRRVVGTWIRVELAEDLLHHDRRIHARGHTY